MPFPKRQNHLAIYRQNPFLKPYALFYYPLKLFARLALKIYCGNVYTHRCDLLRQQGPLLLASNHPNSFLDAVMIASLCRRKTFILVRGDVFKNKWIDWLLRKIYCIPIYRISEGRTLMNRNEQAFQAGLGLLKQGYNLLIFAEGVCENEWKLRPLGKGAARLAQRARQDPKIGSSFKVLPVGITYQDFNHIGKNVFLLIGDPIRCSPQVFGTSAKELSDFNRLLSGQLESLMIRVPENPEEIGRFQRLMAHHIPKTDILAHFRQIQQAMDQPVDQGMDQPITAKQNTRASRWKQVLFAPLSLIGWLIHAPLYFPLKSLAKRKTRGSVYYDSVLFGLLFFLYPLYLVLVILVLTCTTGSAWWLLLLVVLPASAWITLKWSLLQKSFQGYRSGGQFRL